MALQENGPGWRCRAARDYLRKKVTPDEIAGGVVALACAVFVAGQSPNTSKGPDDWPLHHGTVGGSSATGTRGVR